MQNRKLMIMKTDLRKLCYPVFLVSMLSWSVSAQIDYAENFSTEEHQWTDQDFYTTDIAVCNSEAAFRANPSNELGTIMPVEALSPSLGISNGEEAILSYNYKLLYYDSVLPYKAVDDPDWGMLILQYGPTINGPWTDLDVITPQDHIVTDECAARRLSFTPAEGTEVYLRMLAGGGTNPNISYYVYVDDISVLQKNITIQDTETGLSNIKVYPNPASDHVILDYYGNITDVAIFNMQGQEVTVNINTDRNMLRIDMEGLAYGNYILKVNADNQWHTLNVFKK